jgi:O-antigen/teichoic acid export membrane protein
MKKNEKQLLDNSLKLVFKSSFIVFIGVFLSKLLAYAHRVAIARFFDPSEYGTYFLALMIMGWIGIFASLGLQEGVLRYVSFFRGKSEFSKIKYILHKSIKVSVITGVLGSIVLFISSNLIAVHIFNNPSLAIYLKLFSILIPFTLLNNIFFSSLKAFEKVGWYSFLFNIFQNALKLGALLLLIVLGLKSKAIIYSQMITIILLLVFLYAVFKYFISPTLIRKALPNKSREQITRELYSYSWPLMFYGVIGNILYWIDSFTIGYFSNAAQVGLYNVAVPIAALLGFGPELFMQLFLPLISKHYATKKYGVIKETSKQVGKWILMVNLPLLVFMLLFPGVIINLLFGSQYLEAVTALRILAVGSFLTALLVVPNNLLNMAGKSKIILYNTLIIGVVDTIGNILLVPVFGINGAAITTSFSFLLSGIIVTLQTRKYLGIIPIRREVIKIFLVVILPTGIILIARSFLEINLITVILLGTLFAILYASLLILTKCLDTNDWLIINSILAKIKRYSTKEK